MTSKIRISGRIAAIIELGMGFHPDYTWRHNAYMAGQLLGMSSEDVARLMPEIEAFAVPTTVRPPDLAGAWAGARGWTVGDVAKAYFGH